jgi:hypothetical protein
VALKVSTNSAAALGAAAIACSRWRTGSRHARPKGVARQRGNGRRAEKPSVFSLIQASPGKRSRKFADRRSG